MLKWQICFLPTHINRDMFLLTTKGQWKQECEISFHFIYFTFHWSYTDVELVMQLLITKGWESIKYTKLQLTMGAKFGPMGENISRAIENKLLQRLCQPKKDIIRSWGKLHGNKFHDVFCLANIIRMSKSNTVKWTWHVSPVAEMKYAYKI